MPPPPDDACPLDEQPGLGALDAVFTALGRVLVVLDEGLRVLRASRTLDELVTAGASAHALGRHVEELLGTGLFGPDEPVGEALAQGRREEGRRAVLRVADVERLVSVTAAPLPDHVRRLCDPRARHLVVLRPAEEDDEAATIAAVPGLIARSRALQRVVTLLDSLRRSDVPVFVTGESGTGKEVVARALHARSRRAAGPFVAVHCGAHPGEGLDAELFGRGGGRVAEAADGTLFLDEIDTAPLPVQARLLHLLEESARGDGGALAPRVVAATDIDLEDAIARGAFREDLYYRLRVVPIHLPPLRERPEDIAPLAHQLVARVGRRDGRALRLSPDTVRALEGRPWPGNVRELENALQYATAICQGQTIQLEDLPRGAGLGRDTRVEPRADALPAPTDDAEAARIRAALDATRWSRARAAEALGMSRTTLWRRMRELGLE